MAYTLPVNGPGTHAKYLGGRVHNLPLTEENQFLPDLDSVPAEVLKQAKVLVLNYPNNPTGASATPEFFAQVVAFARKHQPGRHPRCGLRGAGVRGPAVELPGDAGREGGGRRTALGQQVLQHDGLALRLCGRQRAAGAGLRGCEGQHRLRPVPGDPARRGARLRPPGDHGEDRGEVFAADGRAGGGAGRGRVPGPQAEGLILPLRQGAQGRREARAARASNSGAPKRSRSG